MKIGRIYRRRGVIQIAEAELEAAIVCKKDNLSFSPISAAQPEEGFKERGSGVDVGDLQVDVIRNDN